MCSQTTQWHPERWPKVPRKLLEVHSLFYAVGIKKFHRVPEKMSSELRSVRARRMITEVEEALLTKSTTQVVAQFPGWQTEFPKIFEILLTRTYKREFLEMMIQQLEKVERGTVSQHNASVTVGTMLVEKVVKPQLQGDKV